jgi:hypothetical protein
VTGLDAQQEDRITGAVAEYKGILKAVLDNRPSGVRNRLALVLGKNRSFISQIANPQYQTPIPLRHVETIFEVCHFSPSARAAFLDAYARAHPRRTGQLADVAKQRTITLHVADLGSKKLNDQVDALIHDLVRKLTAIVHEAK